MSYRALLKRAMEEAGLSQLTLAAKAKSDRPYLQKVLAGKVPPHVSRQVKRIERALGIRDKRLQIAAAVDRGEIDVSHLPRRERERIARMVLGVPEPSSASEALDRREAEEIETSEAMRAEVATRDVIDRAIPAKMLAAPRQKEPLSKEGNSALARATRRKEPRDGTLNARVLARLRTGGRFVPAGIVCALSPPETIARVCNALSSLRTAGWAKSEPGRNGRERFWSLA